MGLPKLIWTLLFKNVMTPEEIEAAQQASADMVENPTPWSELTPLQQSIFRSLLPQPSFSPEQREYLNRWWMPFSQEEIDIINSSSPTWMKFSGKEKDGQLYLCCDILSEGVLENGPLSSIMSLLGSKPLTYILPEEWEVE